MRVIRTEMYFDSSQVISTGKDFQENPGVSTAWFSAAGCDVPSADEIKTILDDKQAKISREITPELFDIFADLSIQNVRSAGAEGAILKGEWNVINPVITTAVLNAQIVYESSPPQLLPVREIAKAGAPVVIGTFLGYEVADGSYPLMFITIPVGIIVIGSAIGISRGLENGLNKFVEGLFKNKGRRKAKK